MQALTTRSKYEPRLKIREIRAKRMKNTKYYGICVNHCISDTFTMVHGQHFSIKNYRVVTF